MNCESLGNHLFSLILVLPLVLQQVADQATTKSAVPISLRQYLELSNEQTERLQRTLGQYNDLVASKRADMRSVQMKAAVDPSVNANRVIERDQVEIEKARVEAQQVLAKTLSSAQLVLLKKLEEKRPNDGDRLTLLAEAVHLNLIEDPEIDRKQPFGGTTPIFANDTASQPEASEHGSRKKGIAKRKPPAAPPP
jgi:septal ring factor EnvC (AmiA/AmiB activator)